MWRIRQFVDKAQDLIAPDTTQEPRQEYGFRVLHVDPSSQCAKAGLEPLFDYIVAVDDQPLECEFHGPELAAPMETFYNLLGSARRLTIWSAKGGTYRTVSVEPAPTSESFGLGITVRWTSTDCAGHVWHVLNVTPGTPAAQAGLLSHSDYIVGAQDGVLEGGGEHMLGKAVANAAHLGTNLILYVYNHDYGVIRPVEIVPRTDAYGNASMGCSIGYGLLHRLPTQVSDGLLAPGSTLYEEEFEPVNSAPPVPTASSSQAAAPPPARKKHHQSKVGGEKNVLGDYFTEQQQISRERDGKSRKAAGDAVAPPPKKAT